MPYMEFVASSVLEI